MSEMDERRGLGLAPLAFVVSAIALLAIAWPTAMFVGEWLKNN